jgi:S-adenosylmethionine uptake transporter
VAVILVGGLIEPSSDSSMLGAAAALGSAVTYAFSMVMLRRQAQRDPAITIVLVMQLVPLAISLPFAVQVWVPPSTSVWALFVLIGMIGVAGHMCLTWAYARAPAGRLGVIDYTALPWAAGLGFLVFGEVPGLPVWLGGGLIVAACLWVARLRG